MFLFLLKNTVLFVILGMIGVFMTPAFAHVSASHSVIGFESGFAHPFSGIDHLLAMLAVGIWAAQNKRPALWVLPIVFPLMMAVGAVVAVAGVHFSGVEIGVATSVMVLGLLIAFAVNMPVWAGSMLVSLFALAHGYVHGVELPNGTSALQYGTGFIMATAALHLLGLTVGLSAGDKMAAKVVRIAGAGIGATGVYLLSGLA
ncbi:MAG TPA: HupE/UreJ family protein [Burkholderiaceae bacterium]